MSGPGPGLTVRILLSRLPVLLAFFPSFVAFANDAAGRFGHWPPAFRIDRPSAFAVFGVDVIIIRRKFDRAL